MDTLTLKAMRYEGRIGVTEEERSFPQMLEVDLLIEADLSAASHSDDLADTVDYAPIVALTERIVESGSFSLLEGLAGALASATLASAPRIDAVIVRVRKLAVPMDVSMDHAEVEIRRAR